MWTLELVRFISTKVHCVRIYVDDILGEIPDSVSDDDYDKIEEAYLSFRKFFTDKLKGSGGGKIPSWYIIKSGKVVACEGYSLITDFQGRESDVAHKIEKAVLGN